MNFFGFLFTPGEKSSRVLWKALFGLVKLTYFHRYLETIVGVLVSENDDARTYMYVQSDIDMDNNDQVSERQDRILEKRDKRDKRD